MGGSKLIKQASKVLVYGRPFETFLKYLYLVIEIGYEEFETNKNKMQTKDNFEPLNIHL